MTIASTAIEIGRPKGWAGEPFDHARRYIDDYMLDYFEVEVGGDVHFWTDNYGADADGNRGVEMTGCDVEDLEFTLYGDFRPWYIRVRDNFLAASMVWPLAYLPEGQRIPLGKYGYLRLDTSLFSSAEIEEASEGLKSDAEDYDGDLRDFDEDAYYERKRENRG